MIDISTEVLPSQIGNICYWHNGVYHRDIGNLESLSQAQVDAPDDIESTVTDVRREHWLSIDNPAIKSLFE
ncbi:MAG: hypothetical protein V3T17_13635 [Pseudomonadales bacterium]